MQHLRQVFATTIILVLMVLTLPFSASAQDAPFSEVPAIQFIGDAFNTGNLDAMEDFIAPNIVYHALGNPASDFAGIDGFVGFVMGGRTMMPDLQVMLQEEVVNGDSVALLWTIIGTHTGEVPGIPASGNAIMLEGMSLIHLEEGKIVEMWQAENELSFLTQIGVLAPPGMEAEAAMPTYELTGTHEFDGFAFNIDYPAGWFTGISDPVTSIYELEIDKRLIYESGKSQGYFISLDHRDMAFMQSIGISADNPTLDDLLNLNKEFFGYEEPFEVEETEAFGVPVLQVHRVDRSNISGIDLMGFVNDEAFLLSINAPSDEALQAFLPTWNTMVESIQPVEG
jgi:steroid delta-isomerase-like uncharacterized protein